MAAENPTNPHVYSQANGRRYPLICLSCRVPFFGFEATQAYCSKACLGLSLKKPPKICVRCGMSFYARGTKRQYCSLDCWYASVREGAEAAFWLLVDKSPHPQGCWIWQGTVRKKKMNYGEFRGELVHRYAYQLYHPDEVLTPEDLICHTCDNCPCVREHHLFKGSYLDNNRDSKQKGRNARGTMVHGAKLTEEQVRAIRKQWQLGGITQRELCRIYQISTPVMCNIVNGTAWKHVKEEC